MLKAKLKETGTRQLVSPSVCQHPSFDNTPSHDNYDTLYNNNHSSFTSQINTCVYLLISTPSYTLYTPLFYSLFPLLSYFCLLSNQSHIYPLTTLISLSSTHTLIYFLSFFPLIIFISPSTPRLSPLSRF